MMKDQQGTFWIGTYYGGINLFKPDYEIYTYYYPDESQKGKLTSPFAGRMKEDSKGGIWIATEGGGVNYLDRKTRALSNINTVIKVIHLHPIQFKLYIWTKRIRYYG